jgi:hypothetical protein
MTYRNWQLPEVFGPSAYPKRSLRPILRIPGASCARSWTTIRHDSFRHAHTLVPTTLLMKAKELFRAVWTSASYQTESACTPPFREALRKPDSRLQSGACVGVSPFGWLLLWPPSPSAPINPKISHPKIHPRLSPKIFLCFPADRASPAWWAALLPSSN